MQIIRIRTFTNRIMSKNLFHSLTILFLFVLPTVLSGQSGSSTQCSSLILDHTISGTLLNDSNIFVCLGDSLKVVDNSYDTSQSSAVDVSYRLNNMGSYINGSVYQDTVKSTSIRRLTFQISNDSGCVLLKEYWIYPVEFKSSITVNDKVQCFEGNKFDFSSTSSATNISSYTIDSVSWSLSSGLDTTARNWSYSFDQADTITLNYVAYLDTYGCVSMDTVDVVVNTSISNEIFSLYGDSIRCYQDASNDSFSFGRNLTFKGDSSAAIKVNLWRSFNDTTLKDTFDWRFRPSVHDFGKSYIINEIELFNGCSHVDSFEIYIAEKPKADITFGDSIICLGSPFTIKNGSVIDEWDPIKEQFYVWDNVDTLYNQNDSFTSFLTDTGEHEIVLFIQSNLGCKSTDTAVGQINAMPNASMSFSRKIKCEGDTTPLVFTSYNPVGNGNTRSWFINGINTSSDSIFRYQPSSSNLQLLKYVFRNQFGCADTISLTIGQSPKPNAVITRTSSDSCLGATQYFRLKNLNGSSSISTAKWIFSDSTQVFDTIANKAFNRIGNDSIKVHVKDEYGCLDTVTKTLKISQPPYSKFAASSLTSCEDEQSFNFYDSSSSVSTIVSRSWIFSDGTIDTISNSQSKSHVFSGPGIFKLFLAVTDNQGCSDTFEDNISVYPKPTADFYANKSVQCLNQNEFVFTNFSNSNGNKSTLTYHWEFGDSTTSNLTNPSKTYSSNDSFTVTLVSTSSQGCSDSKKDTLVVLGLPTVNFSINDSIQCLDDNTFNLDDKSVNNSGFGSINSLQWSFSDNSTALGNKVSKSFNTSGSYEIKLVALLSNGCYDSAVKTVIVNPKPNADFTISNTIQCLTTNNFKANNNSSVIPGGGSLSFKWFADDSLISLSAHPNFIFSNYGKKNIKLNAISQYGCIAKDSLFINVIATPDVSFSVIKSFNQCNSIDTFDLRNTTNVLNGNGVKYRWDFGDGQFSVSDSTVYSYSSPGTYRLVLTAENNTGCKDSSIQTVNIYPNPDANFQISASSFCFKEQEVKAINQSKISVNGGTLTYKWYLDDDSISSSKNIDFSKQNVGLHEVLLYAQSSNGCIDSSKVDFRILNSPIAKFQITDSLQCMSGNKFEFRNLSKVVGTGRNQWNFGDGTGSSLKNPFKVYKNSGNYGVELISTTQSGCSDTVQSQLSVFSEPDIEIAMVDTALCLAGNVFKFEANITNSDSSAYSAFWLFGDGSQDSNEIVSHSYKKAGKYLVRLLVETENACVDSITTEIEVLNQPHATFKVNNLKQCIAGNTFKFENKSTIKNKSYLSTQWDFGDSSAHDTSNNAIHVYSRVDTFNVRLVSFSKYGCSDTFKNEVVLLPQPQAAFVAKDTGVCENVGFVEFVNNSSISKGNLTNQWKFGDGQESIGTNPVNKYKSPGRYLVSLKALSNTGCADSISSFITIHPNPENNFSINRSFQCLRGNKFIFFDSSLIETGTMNYKWIWSDGVISYLKNPEHSFDSFGLYNINQITVSDFGCTDTLVKALRVWPDPVANFSINDSIQCDGNNEIIANNSSTLAFGKFETQWDFGDNTVVKSFHGMHRYSGAGDYSLKQIIKSGEGCVDTLSKYIRILLNPSVDFQLNTKTQCFDRNRFIATNKTKYMGGDSVYYLWDLGNQDTLYQKNLDYNFKEYGSFDIKLIAMSTEGCLDSLVEKIEVFPQGNSVLDVLTDSLCLYNNLVRLGNNSFIPEGNFVSIQWLFGDGNKRTLLNTQPVEYSYNDTGTFHVALVTTTENLCRDTSVGKVVILPMPNAELNVDKRIACFNADPYFLRDVSINPSSYVKREWIMERNIIATDKDIFYSFSQPGNHVALLVISDAFGCTDTSKVDLLVNPSPKASFTINRSEQCLESNEFVFTNTSVGTDDQEGLWLPEKGAAAFEKDFTYQYLNHGDFRVVLKVYSDSGCLDSIAKPVRVNPTPQGKIEFDDVCENIEVDFNGNDTIVKGVISRYEWFMGDGKFLSTRNVSHAYNTFGNFIVTLKLVSDEDCYLDLFDTIVIYRKPEPIIEIEEEKRYTVNKPVIHFYDASYDNPYRDYVWIFGDGSNNQYDSSVTHKFNDSGTFNVQMIVSTFDGCIDTAFKEIRVWPDFNFLFPTAFSPNDDGINDVYRIFGKFQSVKNINIDILNEEGILVFRTNDINDSWNGNVLGSSNLAPMGTYYIQIKMVDIYNDFYQTTKRFNLIR